MPPRRGCRLAVANEAFFHNAQFVIIRPMPAAFTIGCGKYFDLSTIDKVGHKLGLTIGLSLRSDGHRRRFTLIRPENAVRIDMAQRTLIEILLPELRAYATAICQSRDAAEDLVQDAVERGLRSDRRPELLEELRPWMFRVIRNLHYDELRKRRVRREYSAEEKRLSDEAGGPDTARDVLIRLAFEKLPPETREVLCLVDIMGLKYAEAAKVMDVPNGTVMSRISRARRALLDVVDGAGTAKQEVTRKT